MKFKITKKTTITEVAVVDADTIVMASEIALNGQTTKFTTMGQDGKQEVFIIMAQWETLPHENYLSVETVSEK